MVAIHAHSPQTLLCLSLIFICFHIYKYDLLGRLLYTAEITISKSHENWIKFFKNFVMTESFLTEASENYPLEDTGYSKGWYHADPMKLLTVNYYDDYRFLGLSSVGSGFAYREGMEQEYGKRHESTKGLLTGTRIYALDTSNEYLITAYYYDDRGRIIQQHSNNFVNGSDHIYNKYDFAGNIIKKMHTHFHSSRSLSPSAMTVDMIEEIYENEYDHGGRLIKTTYSNRTNYQENGEKVILAAYEYDELGRLTSKKQHNSINTINYQYNIRNQITAISDNNTTYKIYYNEPIYLFPDTTNVYYNGNINGIKWTYNNRGGDYLFNYDGLNRLKSGMSHKNWPTMVIGRDAEIFEYDKHGNITTLKRFKDFNTAIDDLQFTYDGNQVSSITDHVTETQNIYGLKEYTDIQNYRVDFLYDENGNMIMDLDRNIACIQYNSLNLPEVVQFRRGNQIRNRYLADGTKIETNYVTTRSPIDIPLLEVLDINSADWINDVTQDKTFYAGNKDYKEIGNYMGGGGLIINPKPVPVLELLQLHNTEGCLADGKFHYYRKDHLGNNREVWTVNNNMQEVIQRTMYYPSGLPWAEGTGASKQPYKFGGKEFIEMHGYDMYDFTARMYQPTIMRFSTMDPHAENYYSTSPYAYCGNNPVNRIDPDGMDYWSTDNLDLIADFINLWSSGGSQHDFSGWNHSRNAEDSEGRFVYDDIKKRFSITSSEFKDGELTVTRSSYGADIIPIVDQEAYEGAFVYEAREGFLDHLLYYGLDVGRQYSSSSFIWNVSPQGRITGVKPLGGTPPIPGGAKGGNLFVKGFKNVDKLSFHRSIKPMILKEARKTQDFTKIVGKNPDIVVEKGTIVLKGTGQYSKKSFNTGLRATDYFSD